MFDLMSSEYGWTDSQILDLTPGRLRLCTQMIGERRTDAWKEQAGLAEIVSKAIVGGMVGLAQGKKSARGIEKYVKKMKFFKRPKEIPKTSDVMRMFDGR